MTDPTRPSMPTGASRNHELKHRIETVSQHLSAQCQRLFASLPGPVVTPSQLTLVTGLNRNSASKVVRAVNERDPLAAIHTMPGPEALRKLLDGARKRKVPPDLLSDLAAAIDLYERLTTLDFLGKPALDAAVARWLPHARGRVESASRHLVYRGMSALLGASIDTAFTTGFLAPNPDDPSTCDALIAFGTIGLRRLIPDAPVRLMSIHYDTLASRYLTIDGRAMTRRPLDGLIREFSSNPLPPIREVASDEKTVWAVLDGDVAFDAPVDLVVAEVGLMNTPTHPEKGKRVGFWHVVAHPTRSVVIDTFVHRDAWNGLTPSGAVYNTSEFGSAHLNDRSRDIDRIPMACPLTDLGWGFEAATLQSIPTYSDLLTHLCSARGWTPEHFHGYRFSSTYPVFGGQYSVLFQYRT